ncbi:MAG: cobalamin-dependent protein [Spirochaetales bacterium]|nr:cobalamin-dependent protein [Spirochaetales bacterium]
MESEFQAIREELYARILAARPKEAGAIVSEQLERHGAQAVLARVLGPVLASIGERWSHDRISLAVAYVAGRVAEDAIEAIMAGAGADGEAIAGTGRIADPAKVAVIGNAEDDYHGLGRRMVAAFLRVAGWNVVDLGYDVLPADFVDAALAGGARVIGVSAMMLTNAENIRRVREEIERRNLSGRLKLAVGGAVFVMRPELVAEVGGDGTSATAMEAPALFERLAAEAAEVEAEAGGGGGGPGGGAA